MNVESADRADGAAIGLLSRAALDRPAPMGRDHALTRTMTGQDRPGRPIILQVKEKYLGAVMGLETLKVLAGTLGVADFTVNSLARRTGVPRETVDTVLRRHPGAFQKLDQVPGHGRGRPQVRWRLRSDAIDEVMEEVEKLQAAVVPEPMHPARMPDPAVADASLTLAADYVLRASSVGQEAALSLLASARSALRAAGLEPGAGEAFGEGVPPVGNHSNRAQMISAVADLVEALATSDPEDIDAAQARALSIVRRAASSVSAKEWLPLANCAVRAGGTVLAAPIEVVDSEGLRLFKSLFPHLDEVCVSGIDIDYGEVLPAYAKTVVLADTRIRHDNLEECNLSPIMFEVLAGAVTHDPFRGSLRRSTPEAEPITCRAVLAEGVDQACISTATRSEAQLIAVGPDMEKDLAKVVNRVAVGLDAGLPSQYLLIKAKP